MTAPVRVRFDSVVETTTGTSVWHTLGFARELAAPLGLKGNLRRVVCTLNDIETFNCSLFPSKGRYFITLNKKLRDKLGLIPGDTVVVELAKDESRFGMPMPEEFAEVLRQDAEGEGYFNLLTPGNQRLLLKLIVMVSDSDKRIYRSLAVVERLKRSDGRFDYKELCDAMKRTV